jgi:hypothetical protein
MLSVTPVSFDNILDTLTIKQDLRVKIVEKIINEKSLDNFNLVQLIGKLNNLPLVLKKPMIDQMGNFCPC